MTSGVVPQAERIAVHVDPAGMVAAYGRHRRRFASLAAELDPGALKAMSRCSEWSAADVLRHLTDVDGWMETIWAGGPLPFTSFDPQITPHEFVVAGRQIPDTEVRDRYVASAEKMASGVESSDPERFGQPSVSPLGFVPWWLSALHVFWDSWLHERDIGVALGIETVVADDEIEPVLAYAIALAGLIGGTPRDVEVDGMRLMVDEESKVSVTPNDRPGADAPAIIDYLSGRGSFDREPVKSLPRLFQ